MKNKKFTVNFMKEVFGYMTIEAKDKKEALEKLMSGDFIDEYDNKSNYIFEEDKNGNPDLIEDEK